jgi:hypothetical protein
MREFWFTSDNEHLHGIGCYGEDKILVSRTFMKEFLLDVEKEMQIKAEADDMLDMLGKPLQGKELKLKKLEKFIVEHVLMGERRT